MSRAIILGASADSYEVAGNMLRQGIWPGILEPSGAGVIQAKQPAFNGRATLMGEVHFHQLIRRFYIVGEEICSIHALNRITGELTLFVGDYFYFSAPTWELVSFMGYKLRMPSFSDQKVFRNLVATNNRSGFNFK